MQVYGLYGKSGTGKSYQAMGVCRDLEIEAIVDDGLFICGGRVAAGISAKRQATRIGAIKTALFTDEEHCRAVGEKIRQLHPESILILGTSAGMVRKIAERLSLPPVETMIPIEEITTATEREEASRQRKELGKHVIPAPTFQIKRQFSGYILDPLRIFRSKGGGRQDPEKTVVRPTYSYLGDFDLSDRVIADIVGHIGRRLPGISTVIRVVTESGEDGVILYVILTMVYGTRVMDTARSFQERVIRQVEHMTAFNVMSVNVEVRSLK